MENDVFKMLKDIELKAVGLDEESKKMQEGYFISFRNIGLPIHKEDYENPWTPVGGNLAAALPKEASDPKDAPKTGSGKVDTNQAFAANIAKSQQNFLNTFALVDNKLQMSNQYSVMPGSSKLSDTWFAIITGANGIPTDMELSDELKAAYEAATAKLMDKDGNPTPHYEAYMRYEDEWKSKVRARNKAYAAAFTDPMKLQQWPSDGVLYQEDVDEAWNRWMGLGHKVEIEKAIDTLAAQGTDPAIALIARAKKKFQNSLFEFAGYGEIPYVLLSPHSWYDRDNDDGWNTYTTTDQHTETHFTASQTSFGGGAGINLGLWSAGGDFEHDEAKANSSLSVKNLKISFSYAVVDIDRPGMGTSLLNLNNWFLVGDYKANCISTGKMGQEKPGDGTEPSFLPSMVTSLILAKDVLISWDDCEQQWASHTESNSGSASVGILCFTAKAHYSHATQSRDFDGTMTTEGLSIPGIQLIGYVSQIMPPCPQRNSSDFMKKPKTN